MKVGYLFILGTFAILLTSTMEVPIEGSTFPPEPDIIVNHQHGIHVITVHETPDNKKYGISDEEGEKFDIVVDRKNHSRMLTLTTTQGYDDWWFLTTRRQQLSPKDFPGRPGVATWKEISPGASIENRKSRKMTGPTAAEVSSGPQTFALKYHYSQAICSAFLVIFLSLCFCWT